MPLGNDFWYGKLLHIGPEGGIKETYRSNERWWRYWITCRWLMEFAIKLIYRKSEAGSRGLNVKTTSRF
jgi:hypothetical protein